MTIWDKETWHFLLIGTFYKLFLSAVDFLLLSTWLPLWGERDRTEASVTEPGMGWEQSWD